MLWHVSTQPHNSIRVRLMALLEATKKGLASVGVTKLKIVVAFLQVGASRCSMRLHATIMASFRYNQVDS
jgi:hypothetical protein